MSRTALVTGGTRGIGAATCIALRDAGYRVVGNFREDQAAAHAFTESTGVRSYQWDVSDFASCERAVAELECAIGPVDVLVNNAGITRDSPLHKMSSDNWAAVLHTNLDGVFNMSRCVIEGMRARGFGRIISVSSINGQKGQFGQTNYSAAKAGVIGFTKALALENAAKGVTVNAVAPGYVATQMVLAVPKKVLNDAIIPQIPVGRLGTPEDIARAIVFLASDDASFITGSTLTVNGGHHLV